jgi:PAS domain S-box-containing protein
MSNTKPTFNELKERLVIAGREIDELKAKLRESNKEQYFRDLLEVVTTDANVIVAAIDDAFHYIYFNKTYKDEMKRLTGKDIALGANIADYFEHIPEQKKIVIDEWSKVLGGERTNKRLEFGDPDIYRRVYSIFHMPLINAEGLVIGAGEFAYNITEQVKSDEELNAALLKAERHANEIDAVIASIPDGIIIYDKNGNHIFINDSAKKIFKNLNYINEINSDTLEQNFLSGAHRIDGTVLTFKESPIYYSLEKGEIVRNFEIISGVRTGNPCYISITSAPVRSESGQITGAVATFRDITGQKQVLEALRASDERFRLALKNAPVSVGIQDLDLHFLWAYNQRSVKSPDLLIGKTDNDIFISEDAEKLIALKQRVIETGEEISEKMWLTINGKHSFTDLFIKPLRNESGQIEGVGVATVDLTEMRLAQEALSESEKRYRSLFENMNEGFFQAELILDDSGNPVDCRYMNINPAFTRIIGLNHNDVVGKTIRELYANPEKDFLETINKAVRTGMPSFYEGYVQSTDRYYANSFFSLGSWQFACIFSDITGRKKKEEDLNKLNRTLKALSNSSHAMMHASDEKTLLKEVCRIVVEDCGHAMAWVGYAENDENKTVNPVVYAGHSEGYIEKLNVTWADTERGRGPTGTAIRTGRSAGCKNMLTDPNFAPWRYEAIELGYLSSLALPLSAAGRVFGAITIYSKKTDSFSENEITLLSELADDLSFGVMSIRIREANIIAQEELKKSENRFRSLAENAPDIIIRMDKNLRFIYVNSEINHATGLPPGKFIGKTNEELGLSVYLCEIWNKTYENARKTKKIQELDYELFGHSGTRLFHARVVPEVAEGGHVESFLSISRDITEERKIKQELISAQDYLNKLLNYANAPIIVWNIDFRITMFNHAFEHLTDYKSEEVMKKHLNILFPENSREESMIKINQTLKGRYWEVVEIPILTKDGTIKIALWNSANIYAKDGKTLLATIAQGQDITGRKQAEKELERTASFPKENPYPVMRVSKDGYLLFANPGSLPFLNEYNINVKDLIPENIREYVNLAIESGKIFETEIRIQDKIFQTTFTPNPASEYVNIYAIDITKRKQAEEEIVMARDRLEERVRTRTVQLRSLALELSRTEQRERKRLAGILHDNLQQLLVGAKWSIQTTLKKNIDKTLQDSLGRTSELLDESIKASKSIVAELSPPVLHQEGLVAALKWLSRWMAEKHGISIAVNSDIEIEPDRDGICVMLFVSVRELLFNVLKHSGVKKASVFVLYKDNNIEIKVYDQGTGFDATKTSIHSVEGGFGLFSIREKIDLLGGKTIIDSSPGIGTSIVISIPASQAVTFNEDGRVTAIPPVQYAGKKKNAAELHGTKIRVLLVDDHAIMREGLRMMLDPVPDIEIIGEAQDGENALEMARQLRPDMVIMDINMPGMNGIEATKHITSEMPEIKVIGLSMHEEADLASAMMKAGAVDYVHKAGPSQELITCIRAHYPVL